MKQWKKGDRVRYTGPLGGSWQTEESREATVIAVHEDRIEVDGFDGSWYAGRPDMFEPL